jgi:hypothetical protein
MLTIWLRQATSKLCLAKMLASARMLYAWRFSISCMRVDLKDLDHQHKIDETRLGQF